jgi:hypothetical protein
MIYLLYVGKPSVPFCGRGRGKDEGHDENKIKLKCVGIKIVTICFLNTVNVVTGSSILLLFMVVCSLASFTHD